MGSLLGIGCSHGPHLQFPDENMADILRNRLEKDSTPPDAKDPANWPGGMREEWGSDQGLLAAGRHRAEVLKGFRAAREALDAFRPDFILIFGDDQYENFREDLLPPFAVYALNQFDCELYKNSAMMRATTNVWGEPPEKVVTVKGHQEAGNHLAHELVKRGFDVAGSYGFHNTKFASHAFARTILFLDYDCKGLPYPVVPFHVNCYGSALAGGHHWDAPGVIPPPSPMPWRCYDLGREVGKILRDSPWRVAVIGSSSWSHAHLTKKHHYLYPDVEADRVRLAELAAGEQHKWRDLDPQQIVQSGQHEILNWVCLAGVMEGRKPQVLAYGETYIFNSNKPVVLFPVEEAA